MLAQLVHIFVGVPQGTQRDVPKLMRCMHGAKASFADVLLASAVCLMSSSLAVNAEKDEEGKEMLQSVNVVTAKTGTTVQLAK